MTIKQKQCLLAYLGYYTGAIDGLWGDQSRQATENFQRDFGITADGDPGPETQKAMKHAVAYGMPTREEAEIPTVSEKETVETTGTFWDEIEFFDREEFRCPCGNCGGFPVAPDEKLVRAVNEMRRAFGGPVIVVPPDGHSGGSGVRCQAYNDSLPGSVPNSRHVGGKAADFTAPGTPASIIEAYLTKIQSNGTIRYWYKISAGSYHMDVA